MTRILKRPIEVIRTDEYGAPIEFIDRGARYVVTSILDRWIESGDWIRGEGARTIWRVYTDDMALLDVECDWNGKWTIYKAWD